MNQDRKERLGSNNQDQEQILQAEEEEQVIYTDLKHIMKELLFNGARRDIIGNFELSVAQIAPRGEQHIQTDKNQPRQST